MLVIFITVFLLHTTAALDCSVNVTQGVSWSADNRTYTAASLEIIADGFAEPDYSVQLTSSGHVVATDQWNAINSVGNTTAGNTLGYWSYLSPDNLGDFGVVVSSSGPIAEVVSSVQIDGSQCDVATTLAEGAPSGAEAGLQPVSISGVSLVGVDGNPISLKGINWFGLENPGGGFMDGLWAGTDSITKDWSTIVYRLQLLGFNAVRLPISFQNIFNGTPTIVSQACTVDSAATIGSSTTDPAVGNGGQEPPPQPVQPSPAAQIPGVCSADVPTDTMLNRLLYIVRFFAENGFYVIIDNHLNLDNTLLTAGTAAWAQYWQQLAQAIAADPVSSNYVMFDMLNEPDSKGLRWEAANGLPGAGDAYLAGMDAIYSVNPNALLLIEGLGQASDLTLCWGNGFVTDAAVIAQNGYSDPNPFFIQLLTKPYLNNVVISPHIYGPSIALVNSGFSGPALFTKLSTSVGYLNKQGYCSNGVCHQFPIVVGETGSNLQDPRDLQFYDSLRRYINLQEDGDDGLHNAITDVFWWSWNANSGDTHGLVLDDWTTINWQKVQLLEKLINLKPYYSPGGLSGSIESGSDNSAITTPQQTSFPFSAPQRGVTWDLHTLAAQNSTLYGDFAIVLQRVLAFGFDLVVIPFEFNDLSSSGYLSNLVRPCTNTSTQAVQAAALPPGYSATGLTVTLPTVSAVAPLTVDYDKQVCNEFLTNFTGRNRLLFIVESLLNNNITVVLQNTNAYAAQVAPTAWLRYWVNLALALANLDSPRLSLALINTSGSPMLWQSQAGSPGLSELYRSLLPALNDILPTSNFFVEGLNGDDFSGATNYFKNLETLAWVDRVVAFASRNALVSSKNLSASLTYLSDQPGLCLTADKCHQYQVAVAIPDIAAASNQSSLLSATSWIFPATDISKVQTVLTNLTAIGLRPWYYPRSAYSPLPGQAIQGSSSVEAAEFVSSACMVGLTISATDLVGPAISNAVFQLELTNQQETTLFPPWQLNITSASLRSLVYNFEGEVAKTAPGAVSLTFTDYWDALWPLSLNTMNTTIIIGLQPPIKDNITVYLNDQACDIDIAYA